MDDVDARLQDIYQYRVHSNYVLQKLAEVENISPMKQSMCRWE